MILLAKKNLQLAFIAVGVCEVMKVLFKITIVLHGTRYFRPQLYDIGD